MGRYRKIEVAIHNDAKFRTLSDRAKLLWFTLLTLPELTPIGCMKFTESGMAEQMGWSLEAFRKAFQEVLSKGLAEYCPEAKFICFPNFLKHNLPESPNVVRSWGKLDGLLPECELRDKHYQYVKAFVKGLGEAFREAFPEGWRKAMPNPEPEPEPEQERESPSPPPQKSLKKTKTLIPENFTVSDRVKEWAKGKGFDQLNEHMEAFKLKVARGGLTYIDWDAAFMEAVREDWAKIRGQRVGPALAPGRTYDGQCPDCKGSHFRSARPGEKSIGGTVRCECSIDKKGSACA